MVGTQRSVSTPGSTPMNRRLEPRQQLHIMTGFPNAELTTESPGGFCLRNLSRHSLRDQIVDAGLQMETQLVVDVPVNARGTEDVHRP
jgi:hypothetical protein